MDARYYRALARDLMAHAAGTDDPTIAERLRVRAREYLMIADSLEESDAPTPTEAPKHPPKQR